MVMGDFHVVYLIFWYINNMKKKSKGKTILVQATNNLPHRLNKELGDVVITEDTPFLIRI